MPKEGSLIFADLSSPRLDVGCPECGRTGAFWVDELIVQHGGDHRLADFLNAFAGDCERRAALDIRKQCRAHYLPSPPEALVGTAHVMAELLEASQTSAVLAPILSRFDPSWTVFKSFENDQHDRCVDLFVRDDGSFGFEEFRRDVEDQGRWTPISFYSSAVYGSESAAIEAAKAAVRWFENDPDSSACEADRFEQSGI